MELKPLFDEKDLISEWKKFESTFRFFVSGSYQCFYNAKVAKELLFRITSNPENQDLENRISDLQSLVLEGREQFIKELASLNARLDNVQREEKNLQEQMNSGEVCYRRNLLNFGSELKLSAHKAKQEIDHLVVNGRLKEVRCAIYPAAKELKKLMDIFFDQLEFIGFDPRGNTLGFGNDVFEECNFMGYDFLNRIVRDYNDKNEERETSIPVHVKFEDGNVVSEVGEGKLNTPPFDHRIFKDSETHSLFLYLVDRYVNEFRPNEFSQIFHFLRIKKEDGIKLEAETKYREYVKEHYPQMVEKFARMGGGRDAELYTLGQFEKDFIRLNKV